MNNEILENEILEDEKLDQTTDQLDTKISTPEQGTTALTVNTSELNAESLELINKIIAEPDIQKTKDLTYLFNLNQNKKTIVRVNKLNDLLDVVTDQALTRFTKKPDEISNGELIQILKTTQDLIERGQTQVSGVTEQPLIQINQQNNEVNLNGSTTGNLNRDSRERIKNAVMQFLKGVNTQTSDQLQQEQTEEIIDINNENEEKTNHD